MWCLLHCAAKSVGFSCIVMQNKVLIISYCVVAVFILNYVETLLENTLSSSVIVV